MARPLKVGLGYFPLDSDFFVNPKIKALRRAHGSVGLLTFINVLCRAYREGGYYFRFPDIDCLAQDIAEDIANNGLPTVTARVREALRYLLATGTLDEVWFGRGIGTGTSIQEQYVILATKAKRKVDLGVCQLVDPWEVMQKNRVIAEITPVSSEETPVITEESTQSKSKVKEKENTNTLTHARGKNGNVNLTDEEYEDIKKRIPDADAYIDRFSEKLKTRGYRYPSHYQAILDWWERDKDRPQAKTEPTKGSFDLNEFFDAALNKTFNKEDKRNV